MNELKISLIVPVYNAEQYLPKFLDSLVNQTYKDIEILCINDGSSDNSLSILKEYAQKDSRVKIIDKDNQGVSVARNIGILNATGNYILFIDVDDWLELDACEKIYENISETMPDILNFQAYWMSDDNKVKHPFVLQNFINKYKNQTVYFNDEPVNVFKSNDIIFCWDKAYKREFLIKNEINFPETLHLMEDCVFMLLCWKYNPNIKYLDLFLYNHRIDNNNSLTRDNCYAKFINHLRVLPVLNTIIHKSFDEKFCNEIYEYFLKNITSDYPKIIFTDNKEDYFSKLDILFKDNSTIFINPNQFVTYRKFNFWKKVDNLHLSFIYWKIIRPFCKYCIVLPYRRVKNFWRCKNG